MWLIHGLMDATGKKPGTLFAVLSYRVARLPPCLSLEKQRPTRFSQAADLAFDDGLDLSVSPYGNDCGDASDLQVRQDKVGEASLVGAQDARRRARLIHHRRITFYIRGLPAAQRDCHGEARYVAAEMDSGRVATPRPARPPVT